MNEEEFSSELLTSEEVNSENESEEIGSEEVSSEEAGSEEVTSEASSEYIVYVCSDNDYTDTLSHIDNSLTFVSSLLLGALILGGVFVLVRWFFKLFQF